MGRDSEGGEEKRLVGKICIRRRRGGAKGRGGGQGKGVGWRGVRGGGVGPRRSSWWQCCDLHSARRTSSAGWRQVVFESFYRRGAAVLLHSLLILRLGLDAYLLSFIDIFLSMLSWYDVLVTS